MKNYPIGLQGLLEEAAVQATVPVPSSLMKLIIRFQIAHQIVEGGHKLTREEILIILMCEGEKSFKQRIKNYHSKFTAQQQQAAKIQTLKKLLQKFKH